MRFAATLTADKRQHEKKNTPDASCSLQLANAIAELRCAIELADFCKLDAAVAIVAMSAYAGSAVAAAVHDAKYLPNEAAYLNVVRAAIEAYETCDQATIIFREKAND